MPTAAYQRRKGELRAYFDRTARSAWEQLTSEAPVSRIRRTVRAGRAEMQAAILERLPNDLSGLSVLDAGCGAGPLAIEMARRGAAVLGVDVAEGLIAVARRRAAETEDLGARGGSVRFEAGDMLGGAQEASFDHVVAMDSLIHYRAAEIAEAAARLSAMARRSILLTAAPRTPALTAMHFAGRAFPRHDRAPAIEPVTIARLLRRLAAHPSLAEWRAHEARRVARGFYVSSLIEVSRA